MLAPVLALAMTVPADLGRGSRLVANCKAFVRIADANLDGGVLDLAAANSCYGYIDGFMDAVQFKRGEACIGNFSVATMARVYLAHMDKHPTLYDQPQAVGFRASVPDAYPCSVK